MKKRGFKDDPNMHQVGTLMIFYTAGEGKGMAGGFYNELKEDYKDD